MMNRHGFLGSVAFAADGVLRTLCTQRNMKIHWISGLAVMLVGMALPLDLASRASVMICVFFVLAMEVLNTALEAFVDLHVQEYERTAMVAKDAAAAAVLIFAAGAVVILCDILVHRWDMVETSAPAVWRTATAGFPLLVLTAATLGMPRSMPWLLLFTLSACALLGFLAWYSRDEVFSLGALTFVLGAFLARLRETRLVASRRPRSAKGPAGTEGPRPPPRLKEVRLDDRSVGD